MTVAERVPSVPFPAVEVGLLGPLRVTEHGEEVPVRGPKQRAVLAVLALHRGEPVTADRLLDLLWNDEQAANPVNALQAQVSNLRRALGPDVVVTEGAGYALRYDVDGSDARRFEQLASAGRTALDAGDPSRAAEMLRQALDLWRGPALAEFAYEDWARPEISRLEELRAATVDARIDADLAIGRAADLVGEIEALLAQDRLREHRWAQLMLALYRSGRQADALRACADAREVLVEELGIDPGPELVDLERKILDHDPALLPAAEAAGTARRERAGFRLPAPLTRFIGRRRELDEITTVLDRGDRRLVTLIGPGGAGKTRLAVEVARQVAGGNGAALVPLETVSDPAALLPALAKEVGVLREGPGAPAGADLLRSVVAALGDEQVIVVLDNCEHLVAEAAAVTEALLTGCPRLTVIATSREALGVPGEQLYPVGPLEPDDAFELFIERAEGARRQLDEADRPIVAGICARLDGLPLAVELAAARTRALPLGQIAERLADRFRLLTGGARTAVPRQQTLRAVVEWSYDLLFDEERRLFARLAAFAGGWTLDAAETICGDDAIPAVDVLDLLTNLVDKSLVVAEPQPDGSVRYRMLQTLAEYASEHLSAAADGATVRDRHADWYAGIAVGAATGLTSKAALDWRRRLDVDLDNIRAAFEWRCETGQAEGALSIANGIALLWWLRGDPAEGARWAARAAGVAGDVASTARALNQAWGAFYRANAGEDPDEAIATLRSALQEIDDDLAARARATVIHATLLSRRRDPALRRAAEDAIAVAARHGEPWYEGVANALLAYFHVRAGNLDDATAAAERSVTLLRSIDDMALIAEALSVLVTIALITGRLDEAEELVADITADARASGVPQYEQWALTRLGFLRSARDDHAGAAECYAEALAISSDPWVNAYAHLGSAVAALRLGDHDRARQHGEAALALQHRIGAPIEQAHVHVVDGWIALAEGDATCARDAAERATACIPPEGWPAATSMVDELLAGAAVLDGDLAEAGRLLDEAHRLAPIVGHPAWLLTRPDVDAVRAHLETAPTG